MEMKFRLRYVTLDRREVCVPVKAIRGDETTKFASAEDCEPRFFIKRRHANAGFSVRDAAALSTDRVVSPFKVMRFSRSLIPEAELQCCEDGETWRTFDDEVFLYEYWHMNLTQFWIKIKATLDEETLEHCRRQIILKLLEGIGDFQAYRVSHRDIKPDNIMLREGGPDEGLALTDFDAAHDGTQPQDFNAGTPLYLPTWDNASVSDGVWRDLYAVCMVSLWLYNHENLEPLRQLSSGKYPQSEEEISRILKENYPDDFLKEIVPVIMKSVRGLITRNPNSRSQQEERLERECALNLRNALKKRWPAIRLRELLRPSPKPTKWCAVLKVDEDYRPLFGIGREYRILPLIESASNVEKPPGADQPSGADRPTVYAVPAGNGTSYLYAAQERNAKLKSRLSPEIYLSCVIPPDGSPYLEAGIYAKRNQGTQLLTRIRNFSGKDNVTLYSQESGLFPSTILKEVRIPYSCVYAPGERAPERLSLWLGADDPDAAPPDSDCNVNVVFFMDRRTERTEKEGTSLACDLIRQIHKRLSDEPECLPCYYGATIRKDELVSFCGGEDQISADQLIQQYKRACFQNTAFPAWQSRENRRSRCHPLSPAIPTAVIAFLNRPADSWDAIETLLRKAAQNGVGLKYAADYLQLFFTRDCPPEKLFPWLPHLDAMVKPEGSCFVTPLAPAKRKDEKPAAATRSDPPSSGESADPDLSERWLPVILSQCRQRPFI